MAHHPHRRAAAARAGVHTDASWPGTVHRLHDHTLTDAGHSVVGHPKFDPLTRRIQERAARQKAPKQVPEAKHPLAKPVNAKDKAYFAAYHQEMVAEKAFRGDGQNDARYVLQYEEFNRRLRLLRDGYKSKLTLDDYAVNCECDGECSCQNGRVIGEGAFGRVIIASMRPSARAALAGEGEAVDERCVIKIMLKQQIVDDHEVEHTMNERMMLFTLRSDFIMRFYDYMHDSDSVYFVFALAPCSMEKLLEIHGGKFDSSTTQYFAAQLVLAFEYLRNMDVVYRDLKPDNMVVDSKGNMKLIDFGTAKRLDDKTHRTYTFCGTQEYMAPEVLTNRGYSFEVDWWATGVVVFEFLSGRTPFKTSESDLDIVRRICFCKYSFPEGISAVQMMFIGGLLKHDPQHRLGAVAMGGIARLKTDRMFRGIDWEALYAGTLPSPVAAECGKWDGDGLLDNFPKSSKRPFNGWVDNGGEDVDETPFDGAFLQF